MLKGMVLNLSCGLCLAAVGAVVGRVAKKRMDVYSFYFWGNMFAFVWLCAWGNWSSAFSSSSLLCVLTFWMFLGALFNNIGHLLLFHNMTHYHQAASWAMAMSALSVPFVAALLFWREPLTASGFAGLMLILCGIVFLAAARRNGDGRINLKWAVLALGNLFCYGFAQTAMSVPSHCAELDQLGSLRAPLSALFCCIQQFAVILILRRRLPESGAVKASLFYSLLAFMMLLGMYAAMDILTEHKMSRIFWPLTSGTCIVLFSIYSHLVKKEHFSRLDCVGLAMMIVALLLLGDFLL